MTQQFYSLYFDKSYENILLRSIDGLSGEGRQDEAGGVQLGVVEAQLVAVLGAHLPHGSGHLHLAAAADQEPDLTWTHVMMGIGVMELHT